MGRPWYAWVSLRARTLTLHALIIPLTVVTLYLIPLHRHEALTIEIEKCIVIILYNIILDLVFQTGMSTPRKCATS
jgi:hypothetical protein